MFIENLGDFKWKESLIFFTGIWTFISAIVAKTILIIVNLSSFTKSVNDAFMPLIIILSAKYFFHKVHKLKILLDLKAKLCLYSLQCYFSIYIYSMDVLNKICSIIDYCCTAIKISNKLQSVGYNRLQNYD